MNRCRANVIWIYGDLHRGQAQGHMGDPNAVTPNLDRLAADGVTFTRAVSNCPWCTPFRASLHTGLYSHQCCIRTPQRLDPSLPTIARVMGAAGYDTAHFGKWHLDGFREADDMSKRPDLYRVPKQRRGGFGTWIGYENNRSYFDCHVHGHQEDGTEVALRQLPGYETDALTDLFVDYMQTRSAERPFFAVLSVMAPHSEYVAPPEYMRRHPMHAVQLRPNVPDLPHVVERARRDSAGSAAMVENLDANVGRILQCLEQTGLADNTHVIYFSDHGDMLGSHGYFDASLPWEESIRIPLIIGGRSATEKLNRGRLELALNTVDIAPTTLGLCGLAQPDWMQGFDYSGARRHGGTSLERAPESAFLQYCLHDSPFLDWVWRGVITADGWKYVALEGQPFGMFDLNRDPYEMENLAFRRVFLAERKRLQGLLARWIADTGDRFTLPKS